MPFFSLKADCLTTIDFDPDFKIDKNIKIKIRKFCHFRFENGHFLAKVFGHFRVKWGPNRGQIRSIRDLFGHLWFNDKHIILGVSDFANEEEVFIEHLLIFNNVDSYLIPVSRKVALNRVGIPVLAPEYSDHLSSYHQSTRTY